MQYSSVGMSPIQIGTLHFIEKTVYKAQKALVAAKFNGLGLEKKIIDPEADSKKPEFVAKNPTGKVPFLETDTGIIFTSNAIARYVARCRADTCLYGKCFDDEGAIDTWLEFCTHEVEVPLMTWVYPRLGLMEEDAQVTATAQKDVKQALETLETTLKSSEYLIGDFLTVADIALVCALKEGFVRVFEPAFRKPFPKTCAWFERCCKLPQFQTVLGEAKLCEKAEKPIPCEEKPPAPAKSDKKADKKEEKPKAQAKKEEKPKPEKAAAPKAAPATLPAAVPAAAGDFDAQIKEVGDAIRVLKDKLKGEGVTGKKLNEHPEIKSMVERLQELKKQAEAAPAPAAPAPAAPAPAAPAPSGGDSDIVKQVKDVGEEIRTLKEKLKGEGITGKKLNEHPEIKVLVEKLQELKKQVPAA